MNTQDMKTLATDIDALRLRVADLESAGHRMALDRRAKGPAACGRSRLSDGLAGKT